MENLNEQDYKDLFCKLGWNFIVSCERDGNKCLAWREEGGKILTTIHREEILDCIQDCYNQISAKEKKFATK